MHNQGPAVVNYEIYTFDGHRWTLHARFQRSERDAALEEARQIERSLFIGCKVVRETYFPGNNTAEETVIYTSDKALLRPAPLPRRGGPGRPSPGISPRVASPAAGPRDSPRTLAVLARMTLVIAAALTGAGAIAGITWAFLASLPASIAVDASHQSLVLFSSFLVSFLIIAVPLSLRFIQWRNDGATIDRRARRVLAERRPAAAPEPAKTAETPPPQPEAAVPVETPPESPPAPRDPLAEAEQAKIEPIPDLANTVPAPAGKAPVAAPVAPTAPTVPGKAEASEPHKVAMMRLLSVLLAEIKKTRPVLDSYNRFGVDLMLAGAIEVMGSQRGLDAGEKRQILTATIEVMGGQSDIARKFTDKYTDYLVEPRYMTMVQAGRTIMESFLAGGQAGLEQVGAVFDGWNRPQTRQAPPRIMTILFTDMVGSTDLTQARGDHAAQDVVRRHNGIVRAALAEFQGKEIKHTGDGIMASFSSPSNGVEAAIAIQRAVADLTRDQPDLALRIRIGMDAGEPIEEEDDLFGTTVQLASRVCAQSAAGQILCTNVVRELSAGKGFEFIPRGPHALKGFKEEIALYDVPWHPVADETARPGPAEPPAAIPPAAPVPSQAPAADAMPTAAATPTA